MTELLLVALLTPILIVKITRTVWSFLTGLV